MVLHSARTALNDANAMLRGISTGSCPRTISTLTIGAEAGRSTWLLAWTDLVDTIGRYSHHLELRRILSRLAELPAIVRQPKSPPHRRVRRLTADERRTVELSYADCRSVYEVARRFGTTRANVAAILESRGVDRKYNVLSDEDIVRAATLYGDGWSLARLADRYGVSANTVHRALRRLSVKLRPVGTNQWR